MAKDFRNKTFQKILRGYAPEEVDDYIAYINEEYRKLERAKNDSERKLALSVVKLDELTSKSDSNHSSVTDEARADAERIVAEAQAQAEQIIADAKLRAEDTIRSAKIESAAKAKRIIADAEKKSERIKSCADEIYGSANDMYDEVFSFRDSLFELYQTHIESIENMTEKAKKSLGGIDSVYGDYAPEYDESAGDINGEEEDDIEIGLPEEDEGYITEDAELIKNQTFEDAAENDDARDGKPIHIDWKNRRVVINDDGIGDFSGSGDDLKEDEDDSDATRILNLGGIRNSATGMTLIDIADYADDSDFEELDNTESCGDADSFEDNHFSAEEDITSASDNTQPDDFESDDFDEDGDGAVHEFGNIDALFTKGRNTGDMSLTDEFDIVFVNSDSKKDVDEIRRQPTIAPETPKKKTRKF